MNDLNDDQRRVIEAAKTLEGERIEIYAQAVELRIADLLPESFSNFDAEIEDPIEVRMMLGITAKDAQTLNERELRNLVRFFGEEADRCRRERNFLESQDDD